MADCELAGIRQPGDVGQPVGGLLDDQGLGVAVDVHSGNSAIAGSFQDHITFGGEVFAAGGANDGFVAEFAP